MFIITKLLSLERNIEIQKYLFHLCISKIYIFSPVLAPAYIESESKRRVNFRLATAFLSSCAFPKRDRFRPSSLFLHASLCNVARNQMPETRIMKISSSRSLDSFLSLSLYHSCIHPLKFQTPSLAIDITFVRRSKTFSSFMIHRLLSCSDDSCLFRSFGCLSVVRMQTSSNPLFRVEERDSRDINGQFETIIRVCMRFSNHRSDRISRVRLCFINSLRLENDKEKKYTSDNRLGQYVSKQNGTIK